MANMAAADAEISGKEAAEWEECFYGFLAQGKSLHKTFDMTASIVTVPIKSILQKDVIFLLDKK